VHVKIDPGTSFSQSFSQWEITSSTPRSATGMPDTKEEAGCRGIRPPYAGIFI
jgi:hypothetical protein